MASPVMVLTTRAPISSSPIEAALVALRPPPPTSQARAFPIHGAGNTNPVVGRRTSLNPSIAIEAFKPGEMRKNFSSALGNLGLAIRVRARLSRPPRS